MCVLGGGVVSFPSFPTLVNWQERSRGKLWGKKEP